MERIQRNNRLDANVKILYHQTSRENAQLILSRKNKMLRGSDGLASGGIYFAISKEQTDNKAQSKGVYITARVRLGQVKEIDMIASEVITFNKLLSQGYDSVKINRGVDSKTEYVVYNNDQVEILKIEDKDGHTIYINGFLCDVEDLLQFDNSDNGFDKPIGLNPMILLKILFQIILVVCGQFVTIYIIYPFSEIFLILSLIFLLICGFYHLVRQIGAGFLFIFIVSLNVSIYTKFTWIPSNIPPDQIIIILYIFFLILNGAIFITGKVGTKGFFLFYLVFIAAFMCQNCKTEFMVFMNNLLCRKYI